MEMRLEVDLGGGIRPILEGDGKEGWKDRFDVVFALGYG